MPGYKQIEPRYKKGESGNPKGRPPMPDLKQAISDLLNDEQNGMTALQAILRALFKRALNGDVRAAQELLDRGFGKSTQLVDANINVEADTAKAVHTFIELVKAETHE